MKYPKISIIIPLYVIEKRFFDDLKKFSVLNYPNYEILVVCDKKVELTGKNVRLILTRKKRTGPAEKRDIAIKAATGIYCAFIDDDAYPDKNWLKNAIHHFGHERIGAVGGPGLTPSEDGFWEQITGLIYQSYFCGGPTQHRFKKAKINFVEDYPAYNLIVKKSVLKKIGGYGNHFYGGEDTFLCLKIIKAGYHILYDPEVVVYHHRRPLFIPYLKQIANIGKHRGYFAKKFPETSMRFFYFMPSFAFLMFCLLIVGSLINIHLLEIFITLLFGGIIVGMSSVIKKNNIGISFLVSIGIILTHLVYGAYFLYGLTINDLKR